MDCNWNYITVNIIFWLYFISYVLIRFNANITYEELEILYLTYFVGQYLGIFRIRKHRLPTHMFIFALRAIKVELLVLPGFQEHAAPQDMEDPPSMNI